MFTDKGLLPQIMWAKPDKPVVSRNESGYPTDFIRLLYFLGEQSIQGE
ncbi:MULTISPECIES: hypothetical protein [Loigolactobacillus]|nr:MULTISPECIES: hypothetical protein [Loigolactobacillus]MDA5387684.1 hypothetical protein [Loigolactobacillus backii]MDA5390248.1 hypothetical protein [Loigolactobacillus backii]